MKNYVAASEYEAQFWILLRDILVSLDKVKYNTTSLTDNLAPGKGQKEINVEVENIIESVQHLISNMNIIKDDVNNRTESSITLLSRKDDLARQIEESTQSLEMHFNKEKLAEEMFSKSQFLDIESEKSKRRLVMKALNSQKSIARLQEQVSLLSGLVKQPSSAKSTAPFSRVQRRRPKKTPDVTGTKLVFQSLKNGFERTRKLRDTTENLSNEVDSYLQENVGDTAIDTPRQSSSARSRRNKKRIEPLPFSSPSSFASASKAKQDVPTMSTIKALRTLKKKHHVAVKRFERRDLNFSSDKNGDNLRDAQSWRSKTSSQLMNTSRSLNTSRIGMPLAASNSQGSKERSLVIEKSRDGWNNTDTRLVESTQLNLPTSLKQIDADKAANQALAPFGVTPELMSSVQKIKERSVVRNKAPSEANLKKGTIAKLPGGYPPVSSKAPTPFGAPGGSKEEAKPSSSMAFPPMSKTAPKLFSEKGQSKNIESTSIKAAEASAMAPLAAKKSRGAAAFPPLSAKAPTPFGGSKSAKSADLKSADKKESSSGLFGFSKPTQTKDDNDKKDEPKQTSSATFGFGKTAQSKNGTEKKDESKPSTEIFGGMMGMSNALDVPASKPTQGTSTVPQSSGDTNKADYKAILTQFYTTHNASKAGEVDKTLQKYKVSHIHIT